MNEKYFKAQEKLKDYLSWLAIKKSPCLWQIEVDNTFLLKAYQVKFIGCV